MNIFLCQEEITLNKEEYIPLSGEITLNKEEYIPLSGGNSIRKYKCFTMWKNGAIKVQFNQKINLNSRGL